MSEPMLVRADMERIVALMDPAPSLFFMLTGCMAAQSDIDPDAGYGPFQIPTLVFDLIDNTPEDHDPWSIEFFNRMAHRLMPYAEKFYVLIRGIYTMAATRKEVQAWMNAHGELDFQDIYVETKKLVPSFGKPGIMELLR